MVRHVPAILCHDLPCYVRLFATSLYLTNNRLYHTEAARRMGIEAGVLEHQLVWQEGFVVGVLGADSSPLLWESHGANNLGTEASSRGPGKTAARQTWSDRGPDDAGIARPTPTQTKPCSLDASKAPIPETGDATLCRSEPGHLRPTESKTQQNA